MRREYERIPGLDAKHEEIHRKAFKTPYLIREVSGTPSADELDELELVYNSTDNKICMKINGVVKSSEAFT